MTSLAAALRLRPPPRTVPVAVVTAVVVVLVVIAGAVSIGGVAYLGVNSHRLVTLPAPTGPYGVGRIVEDWVDHSRIDPLSPTRARRELSVWIWYPARANTRGTPAAYLPSTWSHERHLGLLQSLLRTAPSLIHPHARDDAAVAAGRFPLLVFEPGLGLAAYDYTTIAEDLASHGYVVAGVNPTYSTDVVLSRGRVIRATRAGTADDGNDSRQIPRLLTIWSADMTFVAARLRARYAASGRFDGHLAAGRVGFFGHSLGGAAAATACRAESECVGAADVDGNLWGTVVRSGIGKPFLFIGHQGSLQEPKTAADVRGVLRNVPKGEGHVLTVQGTANQNFTDRAVYYWALLRPLRLLGPINGRRGLAITSRYLRAFFDRPLKDVSSSLLDGPSRVYGEVRFETP